MKIKILLFLLFNLIIHKPYGQKTEVTSPDKNIIVNVDNSEKLIYSITYKRITITSESQLGFEFMNEPAMTGNFSVMPDQKMLKFCSGCIPAM